MGLVPVAQRQSIVSIRWEFMNMTDMFVIRRYTVKWDIGNGEFMDQFIPRYFFTYVMAQRHATTLNMDNEPIRGRWYALVWDRKANTPA